MMKVDNITSAEGKFIGAEGEGFPGHPVFISGGDQRNILTVDSILAEEPQDIGGP
jgi:hypothetical protein